MRESATQVAAQQVSSLRTQGPITTGRCELSKVSATACNYWGRGVWVPAFAGTTGYIGRYARTSAGTLTPSLIWPTDLMMSSPSSWAKQA